MMIQRCLAVLLLALPLFGQATPLIPWIGTTERVIPTNSVVTIPVTLAAEVKDAPQVRQVIYLGEEIDPKSVLAKWTGAGLTRELTLTVDAKPTYRIGTYTAFIHIATPDAAKFAERLIEVKLVRRGPALSVPTPLRAERVTFIPGWWDRWYPESWTVNETSLRDTFQPAASRWAVTLKTADAAPSGSLLYIDLAPTTPQKKGDTTPVALAPGAQALLKPVSGKSCCPFGTVSGKFSINEVPLAAPIEVSVEVLSRLSRWWLFAILIGSIILGHYARKILEERRARATANIAAAAVRDDLKALLATVEGDDAFTQSVKGERQKLYAAMKTNDVAKIDAAVTAGTAAVTKIRADHAKARKDAKDLIKTVRDAIGDPEAQSRELRTAATKIDAQLDAVEARLATGRVTGVLEEVQAIEHDAVETTARALIGWQTPLANLLDEMQKWADVDGAPLAQLATKVGALNSEDLAQMKSAFATAATADAQLHARLPWFLGEVERIVALVKEIAAGVTLQPPAGGLTQPEATAKQLRDLRDALQKALRDAVPKGQTAPVSIKESKFEDAVAEVKKLQKPVTKTAATEDEILGDLDNDSGAIVASALAANRTFAPAAAPVSTLAATIEVSDDAVVGEPLHLTFRVTDNGVPVEHAHVQWWIGDSYISAGTMLVYTPASTAPAVLRARTTVGSRTIERAERIAAAPGSSFDPDQLRDELTNVNWIQTGIAGFFITWIGYSLFAKSFVGTVADLITPALWGFATDITLAKLVEFAQPVLQKAVPAAAAAPAKTAPPKPAPAKPAPPKADPPKEEEEKEEK